MGFQYSEKRSDVRYDVLECGMLWRPNGTIPERVGPALITNASISGVQLRTRTSLAAAEDLLLQLGSEEGPMFIPGTIKYVRSTDEGATAIGFHFEPRTYRDREAIAKYMLTLKERVCANA
jgi:hypothetical protein